MNPLYLHLVFSTQSNYPFIDQGIQEDLFAYLRSIFEDQGCTTLAIGGYTEHVHLLLCFRPDQRISDLVSTVKSSSTRWVRKRAERYRGFRWQPGYRAFTISPHRVTRVERFILNQESQHQILDFQEEMAAIVAEARRETY